MSANGPLYIFIDESGNFDFSPKGTKYYTITAVITHTPWEKAEEIAKLHHLILSREIIPWLDEDYLEEKLCHHFHATEDKQIVRDELYSIIQQMQGFKVHSIVVQKNKTNPSIRNPTKFYSMMVGYLLDYIIRSYVYSSLVIFIDGSPINKLKRAIISSIKSEIKSKKPRRPFVIYFPRSDSNYFLQISDYVNWAIFRKWEKADSRSYNIIRNFLGAPELDIFRSGATEYY